MLRINIDNKFNKKYCQSEQAGNSKLDFNFTNNNKSYCSNTYQGDRIIEPPPPN